MEQMENIITDVDNSQGLFFPTVIDNLVKDDAVNREVNRNDCLGKLGVGLGLHFPLPQEVRFLIGLHTLSCASTAARGGKRMLTWHGRHTKYCTRRLTLTVPTRAV